jgi:hypothetical protein
MQFKVFPELPGRLIVDVMWGLGTALAEGALVATDELLFSNQ